MSALEAWLAPRAPTQAYISLLFSAGYISLPFSACYISLLFFRAAVYLSTFFSMLYFFTFLPCHIFLVFGHEISSYSSNDEDHNMTFLVIGLYGEWSACYTWVRQAAHDIILRWWWCWNIILLGRQAGRQAAHDIITRTENLLWRCPTLPHHHHWPCVWS